MAIAAACAIILSVWPAVIEGQAAPTGAPSAELRAHLKSDRFQIVTSVRGLPLGVRDGLQMLFGSASLDIADPGVPFQATGGTGDPRLPIRRLVAAGCASDSHCLVYYERGGGVRTARVALFHWTPDATRFEWGAAAPAGLQTIEDVRNAILSGAAGSDTSLW
jgi:hypothetical protein